MIVTQIAYRVTGLQVYTYKYIFNTFSDNTCLSGEKSSPVAGLPVYTIQVYVLIMVSMVFHWYHLCIKLEVYDQWQCIT